VTSGMAHGACKTVLDRAGPGSNLDEVELGRSRQAENGLSGLR
jgi:hypothetical protein